MCWSADKKALGGAGNSAHVQSSRALCSTRFAEQANNEDAGYIRPSPILQFSCEQWSYIYYISHRLNNEY